MSKIATWLGARRKAIVAAAALALTVTTALYAGHVPHWLVIVIAVAGVLGVHQVPNA